MPKMFCDAAAIDESIIEDDLDLVVDDAAVPDLQRVIVENAGAKAGSNEALPDLQAIEDDIPACNQHPDAVSAAQHDKAAPIDRAVFDRFGTGDRNRVPVGATVEVDQPPNGQGGVERVLVAALRRADANSRVGPRGLSRRQRREREQNHRRKGPSQDISHHSRLPSGP